MEAEPIELQVGRLIVIVGIEGGDVGDATLKEELALDVHPLLVAVTEYDTPLVRPIINPVPSTDGPLGVML
jgi:hypothetical protein